MSKKYEESSKNLSSKDSRLNSRKRSRDDTKNYSSEIKTPPLPTKHGNIEKLMRQRDSIKEELKNIAKHKRERKPIENCKKQKNEQNLLKQLKNEQKSEVPSEITEEVNMFKDPSPEYNQDYAQSDSEDEENIIAQRRQQRKQLLEELSLTNAETSKDTFQDESNSNCSDNQSQEEAKSEEAQIHLLQKNISIKNTTDMFSEEDFAPKTDSDSVTQDNNIDNSQLNDNWDDLEGYYSIKIGDMINKSRYTIKSLLGKGVFANVVKAQDHSNNVEVAIKIIRNNDLMYNTGLKEIETLKEVNDSDPENKYHCLRFFSDFMHKGHLCLVLESLHMDLRSIIKKYGKHRGLNIKALMSYSRQLLLALRLLKKLGIIHADVKPDNILVNEKKNILKLCDFGSATKIYINEPTPYLVSRFYRAPEIILGIPIRHGVDIWSCACTIFEMATGKILFMGSSNNRMLKCFMDLKGKIPSRMIRKGKFKDQHFNYNNNFLLHKKDEYTGREKVVEIANIAITRPLCTELKKIYKGTTTNEDKKIMQLKDLLDKMLILDSNHRYSPTDCLKHPFIQEQLQK